MEARVVNVLYTTIIIRNGFDIVRGVTNGVVIIHWDYSLVQNKREYMIIYFVEEFPPTAYMVFLSENSKTSSGIRGKTSP